MCKRLISIALLFVSLSTVSGEIRVGIIPTEESARTAADVLTTSLGKLTNVVLLERAEIDRIYREQSLASASQINHAHLGGLLRADGLVMIEPIKTGYGSYFGLRLVAVKSGIVLDGAQYPLPLGDPGQWAKLVSARLSSLIPKLEIAREKAIPISLVNLRAAVNTPFSVEFEKQLSRLLYHRLMADKELFVLERRQLGKLAWEKPLEGTNENSFWNGAYLLEGVIDREGSSSETLTLHVRLSSPNHDKPIEVEASGSRRMPTEVVDQLGARIAQALHLASGGSRWDPDAEAQRYEEEALWALRWKTWSEAYRAADSAYALGRKTESLAEIKVRALLEQAHIPAYGRGWFYDRVRNCAWNVRQLSPEVTSLAVDALGTYRAHCLSTDTNRWQTNVAWLNTGVYALQTASEVLRHQYFYALKNTLSDENLPELRVEARDLSDVLSRFTWPALEPPRNYREEPPMTVQRLKGISGPLWQETPEAGINLFREMMNSGAYGQERFPILLGGFYATGARLLWDPFWVGWTQVDRERGAKLWKAFISELLQSTNRTLRADGALLKLYNSVYDPDIAMSAEQFYDAVMDENRMRFVPEVHYSLDDAFDNLLRCKGTNTLRRVRLIKKWESHSFARLIHYLQTTTAHDASRICIPLERYNLSQTEADQLISTMDDYRTRFPRADIGCVQRKLEKYRQAKQKIPQLRAEVPQVRSNREPAVLKPAFRRAKYKMPDSPRVVSTQFENLIEYDNRWYAIAVYVESGMPQYSGVIVEVDLQTGQSKELVPDVPCNTRIWGTRFQIVKGDIYWINGENTIDRWSNQKVSSFRVDVPLQNANLTQCRDRLFVTSLEYIAEMLPDGQLKLLASARRRPASNKLDAWTWTTLPSMDVQQRGPLLAIFKNVIWTQTEKGDWDQKLFDFGPRRSFSYLGEGRFLVYPSDSQECFVSICRDSGHHEVLLSKDPALLPHWPMPFDYPLTPGLFIGGMQGLHSSDGTNLWILLPGHGVDRLNGSAKPTDATLLWFDPRWEKPKSIRLSLEGDFDFQRTFKTTRQGVVIWTFTYENITSGFWFIGWAELDNWLKTNSADSRNLPRRQPEKMGRSTPRN